MKTCRKRAYNNIYPQSLFGGICLVTGKISPKDKDNVFLMKHNEETGNTTCAVCKLSDYNKVDIDDIERSVDITASSIFDDYPFIIKYISEDDND